MRRKPLYIETKIKCDLGLLWEYSQTPDLHQQWDLRFTEIKYLPKVSPKAAQKFLYSTQVGFGIKVKGFGESTGVKKRGGGESVSVLRFWSDQDISIIRKGAGYWKYVPEKDGIKFFTCYDYETRWGFLGKAIDCLIFRPLMVWATAWSFDRLKNWIEKGFHPKQAAFSQLTVLLASVALGIVWIYQGLIPKLMFTDTGELRMLSQSGIFNGCEREFLRAIGFGEILFGLCVIFVQRKWVHIANILALLLLGLGALWSDPAIFTFPFNPFSLNLSMVALSVAALLNFGYLPKAGNCVTRQRL